MDPDRKRIIVEFDQLNPMGRVVWLTGAAMRLGSGALRRAVHIATETRQAFREGLHSTTPRQTPPSSKS